MLAAAAEIAADHAASISMRLDTSAARELDTGWYFPWTAGTPPEAGSNGIIVNKHTGAIFTLGSAFPVERDLRFYDKGYQSDLYDLVITAVIDIDAAVGHLSRIGPTVIIPEYDSGTVWRIPQPMSAEVIRRRLRTLPVVFPDITLYFRLEILDSVEIDGSFEFKALRRSS